MLNIYEEWSMQIRGIVPKLVVTLARLPLCFVTIVPRRGQGCGIC